MPSGIEEFPLLQQQQGARKKLLQDASGVMLIASPFVMLGSLVGFLFMSRAMFFRRNQVLSIVGTVGLIACVSLLFLGMFAAMLNELASQKMQEEDSSMRHGGWSTFACLSPSFYVYAYSALQPRISLNRKLSIEGADQCEKKRGRLGLSSWNVLAGIVGGLIFTASAILLGVRCKALLSHGVSRAPIVMGAVMIVGLLLMVVPAVVVSVAAFKRGCKLDVDASDANVSPESKEKDKRISDTPIGGMQDSDVDARDANVSSKEPKEKEIPDTQSGVQDSSKEPPKLYPSATPSQVGSFSGEGSQAASSDADRDQKSAPSAGACK